MNNNINIALYQPEIPPNTGNIIRLCANTESRLHLIHPMGFDLTDKQVKRAGLDYHEMARVTEYPDFNSFTQAMSGNRLFAISTKGTRLYTDVLYEANDVFLFGPETRGLPQEILSSLPAEHIIRIPMAPGNRSLNLSNAVAVMAYEAWRQRGFLCE